MLTATLAAGVTEVLQSGGYFDIVSGLISTLSTGTSSVLDTTDLDIAGRTGTSSVQRLELLTPAAE